MWKKRKTSFISDDITSGSYETQEIKTKRNVFFSKNLWFEWTIYKWHHSLDEKTVIKLKNTPFYKNWTILISK